MNRTTPAALVLLAIAMALPLVSCAQRKQVWQDITGAFHEPLRPNARTATVLLFIAPDCPISNAYAPEISRIADAYSHRRDVQFLAVHADPTVQAGDARRHALAYGYQIPVLLDPEQKLVRRVGPTVTPEAAVLDRSGRVVYLGRIDDLYYAYGKRRQAPTRRELRDAIDAVLEGRDVEQARVPAIGCDIEIHRKAES